MKPLHFYEYLLAQGAELTLEGDQLVCTGACLTEDVVGELRVNQKELARLVRINANGVLSGGVVELDAQDTLAKILRKGFMQA